MTATTRFEQIRAAASKREHGTRARYVADRCRCMLCRAANSRYSCARDRARRLGDHGEIVSAEAAVKHIRQLGKLGVGYKSVADAAAVSRGIVKRILYGGASQIRKSTEARILAVDADARSGGSLVPAGPTCKLVEELLRQGYTQTQLAKWLGYKGVSLQLHTKEHITWTRAVAIEKLYRGIEAGRYQR